MLSKLPFKSADAIGAQSPMQDLVLARTFIADLRKKHEPISASAYYGYVLSINPGYFVHCYSLAGGIG
jgi:hypothetical protein